ncbi:hypothetical protein IWZ03DRAFT_4155 [Phyllosticta citriasiana]|uniref:Secreted protein n=1 Tax=Phyllosticta citriasiana TaxID=595635 RepID=A0ABR1KX52_9PEZI
MGKNAAWMICAFLPLGYGTLGVGKTDGVESVEMCGTQSGDRASLQTLELKWEHDCGTGKISLDSASDRLESNGSCSWCREWDYSPVTFEVPSTRLDRTDSSKSSSE